MGSRIGIFLTKGGETTNRIDTQFKGFPGGSEGKVSAYNAGDPGSELEKGMATHPNILAPPPKKGLK